MTLHAGDSPLAGSSEHTIENLTLSLANFEYSYTFPMRTRKIGVKPRSSTSTLKVSLTSGESGTTFITVPPGGWWQDMVGLDKQTLYIQSETDGEIVEIESWR